MRILLGLILWSLIEIGLFVVVGGAIGLLATLGVVLGSAMLGVWLIRERGLGALSELRGGVRGAVLAEVGLTTLAGVMLIMPGLMTDALGLALLIPWVQRHVVLTLAGRMQAAARYGSAASDVVEGEAVEIDAPRLGQPRQPSGWTKD